ncbi:hypothetical protein [Candidatus Hakubella thermalkaliphila]|uniref:hypothetical protein n=1 Tax=Candidatus Hakubella thermalkaliphila TaxID=2754717 RepID=UPI001594D2B0|nr:hypothetical protein [Candidatus Hakubella thermalkaliphila]
MICKSRRRSEIGGHKAAAIASLLKKVDIYLVSSLSASFVNRIGLRPARSVEEALAMAFQKIGSEAKVLVAPHGRVVRLFA